MARLVPDSSITLTWCFEDEATAWSDSVLAQLKAGDEAIVPAHWPAEVANALLIGIRRGRVGRERVNRFFEDLRALPIRVDPASAEGAFGPAFALAEQFGLTVYDAAYLELAIRHGIPLATRDDDLRRAARAARVPLLESQS